MRKQRLETDLFRDEGLRLTVYDDATGKALQPGMTLQGYATIGIGRNLHRGLSRAEAKMLFYNDVAGVIEDLFTAFPWTERLGSVRQEVLANMLFNLGLNRLKSFKRMLSAAKGGRYAEAADEMLDSKWAQQAGLRAVRLAEGMRHGRHTI